MRLVCPNCAAQYEVDDRAVPEDGRDVQCANCGDTWFQEPVKITQNDRREARRATRAQRKAEHPSNDVVETGGETTEHAEAEAPTADENRRLPRSQVDQSVLDILRSEAANEAKARSGTAEQEDVGVPEVNFTPDLPEDPVDEDASLELRARAERARLNARRERERRLSIDASQAETYGEEMVAPAPSRGAQDTGRNRLPDVDQLNSSLRSASDASRPDSGKTGDTGLKQAKRSGSYRFGFFLSVFIALVLAALYLLEPQIADAVPDAQPYLAKYVEIIDILRIQLDRFVSFVADLISSLIKSFR